MGKALARENGRDHLGVLALRTIVEACRVPFGETNIPTASQPQRKDTPMGDRSPKSVQKQAAQKNAKNSASSAKKQAVITSQQETKLKAAAKKK